MTLTSVTEAKGQAKALRAALAARGQEISHAQALELVAQQHGARDWNTLSAQLSRAAPQGFQLNDRVQGRYLGQAFAGRIIALSTAGEYLQVSIRLDVPVDVVQFESFSNLRRQIRGLIGADGRSPRKTSDGTPHLVLELMR